MGSGLGNPNNKIINIRPQGCSISKQIYSICEKL
jgi:hypothetical protein